MARYVYIVSHITYGKKFTSKQEAVTYARTLPGNVLVTRHDKKGNEVVVYVCYSLSLPC